MTPKNQRMRDALKQIEGTITSALAHQPEDDAQCGQFLYDALVSVFNTADLAAHTYRGVTTYCRPIAAAPAATSTPDGAAPSAPVPSVPEVPSVPSNEAKLREALDEIVDNIEMRASVSDIFTIIDRKTFLDAKAALATTSNQNTQED